MGGSFFLAFITGRQDAQTLMAKDKKQGKIFERLYALRD